MPYRVENIVRKGEIACYLALYRQKEILQNSSSLKKKKKKKKLAVVLSKISGERSRAILALLFVL